MAQSKKTILICCVFILGMSLPDAWARRHRDETERASKPQSVETSTPSADESVRPLPVEDLATWDALLSSQIPAVWLKQAEALRQASRYLSSGEIALTLQALKQIPDDSILNPEARYLKARALMQQEKHAEALQLLQTRFDFESPQDSDEFWLRANLLAETQQIQTLQKSIADIEQRYPQDKNTQIKGHYFLGKGLLKAGFKNEALRQFETVLVVYPGSEYDQRILALLKKDNLSVESILSEALLNQRAEKLLTTGYAHEGRALIEKLASRDPQRYQERLAYAYFCERRYPEAAALYEDILKQGRTQTDRLTLHTRLAQAYARSKKSLKAIEVNREIMKLAPSSAAAKQARGKLGFLYFDAGSYQKAIEEFGVPKSKGKNQSSALQNWYRFWAYFLKKDYPAALQEAKFNLAHPTRDQPSSLWLYWIGRVYEKMDQHAAAKKYDAQLVERDPDGYYGLLARQRLQSSHLAPRTLISPSLVRVTAAKPTQNTLTAEELHRLPELQRALLLYRAGFDARAFSATQDFLKSYRGVVSAPLVRTLQNAGNFHHSFALKGAASSGRVPACDSACAERFAYPFAYEKYVRPFAKSQNVNPTLVQAVMRQESAFKPLVASNAFAYGLMQIIPPTAATVAHDIGYPHFHTEKLKEPKTNLLLGVAYLQQLLAHFSGETVFAIAAYNAGPEAVDRWRKQYPDVSLDVFIELIPYTETRDYVKKVLVNALFYERLYPSF